MVAAVPSLMLTYGSDTTLFGFSSTSQQLGSGANANLTLDGSENVNEERQHNREYTIYLLNLSLSKF